MEGANFMPFSLHNEPYRFVTSLFLHVGMIHLMFNMYALLMVMAINLGYGFLVSGIDNAGHIGGAITGAVLGLLYVINVKFAKNKLSFAKSSPFMLIGQGLILAIFLAI